MQVKGVVFEGKTLDDAVKRGLEALGLSRAEVMITVLEEGSGGFLGIGARPYKVRMMPRPRRELAEPRREGGRGRGRDGEPARERDRGRDRERGRRSSRGEGRGEPRADRRGEGRSEPRADRRGEGRREGRGDGRARPPVEVAPRQEMNGASGREDRGRRRRRRERPGEPETAHADPAQALARREQPDRPPVPVRERAPAAAVEPVVVAPRGPDMSDDDLSRAAQRHTEDLLRAMGFEATVSARAEDLSVEVRAEVPQDSDLLAGHKGEVRQALQHLLNRMLNRGQGSRYHLQLEINDFWQQREAELRALARQLAEEALADGGEKLTEYLNAQERRIVHVMLKDDPRVKTYAIGDGLIKKVAVAPADYPEGPKGEE